MDEYNFKFRVVKNIGSRSEEMFGKVGTIIEVKDGKFIDKIGTKYGYCGEWNFESLKSHLEHLTYVNEKKTEIELVEESEELTPVEFLQLCLEICSKSLCNENECIMFSENSCYCDNASDIKNVYEIVKQYKKDKEAKEKQPVYTAKWKYGCYLEDKLMNTVETEEQAIKWCEELASENPFDRNASYKKNMRI